MEGEVPRALCLPALGYLTGQGMYLWDDGPSSGEVQRSKVQIGR